MTIDDVIRDIHKLVGLELDSVKPGAKITILEIDEERGSLTLKNASGQRRSRPLEEIRKIWNQMMIQPAVHVEGVLHGSGTSRNQPETILANLPYIEWLKVDNKKHLAYVGTDSHPYGTIKKMDDISSAKIKAQIEQENKSGQFKVAIVSADVNQCIQEMQKLCQGTITTLDRGLYQLNTGTEKVVFLAADVYGIDEGTYCVIDAVSNTQMLKRISIYKRMFSVYSQGNIKAFIEEK